MDATLRLAEAHDVDALLALMRAYYAEEGYRFVEAGARAALLQLAADPALGRLWRIDEGGTLVGYLAFTFGFSLEYRGRDAFVDELYLLPAARGRGLGSAALRVAEAACRDAGVQALHLEAERTKPRLLRFYARAGFEPHDRHLMTRWLGAPEEE